MFSSPYPSPSESAQWEDRDGDNRGDNPDGNNPDQFPDDASQWEDSDGDGRGDNPGGNNGDRFPADPTQWDDTDGDGYGDNQDGNEPDVCPESYGTSNNPLTRGCPDTDADGVTDPLDAFPNDPFQWADSDGDGYGDENIPGGDDCPDQNIINCIQEVNVDVEGDITVTDGGSFVFKPEMDNNCSLNMTTEEYNAMANHHHYIFQLIYPYHYYHHHQ